MPVKNKRYFPMFQIIAESGDGHKGQAREWGYHISRPEPKYARGIDFMAILNYSFQKE